MQQTRLLFSSLLGLADICYICKDAGRQLKFSGLGSTGTQDVDTPKKRNEGKKYHSYERAQVESLPVPQSGSE